MSFLRSCDSDCCNAIASSLRDLSENLTPVRGRTGALLQAAEGIVLCYSFRVLPPLHSQRCDTQIICYQRIILTTAKSLYKSKINSAWKCATILMKEKRQRELVNRHHRHQQPDVLHRRGRVRGRRISLWSRRRRKTRHGELGCMNKAGQAVLVFGHFPPDWDRRRSGRCTWREESR